ncbi:PREDICTED: U7 snRNA-associated Sm-like protein LSm11 [Fulmarus glacialis]|uniref:U7 snRNA-associated Sm-like protein LSm11 n=1 Tax=Fulmarus glacialis TaxID=30455 RepID=UPI00051C515C|nr:PREDICTED: U7 snRNA-associated Sm-like protein LSm11 [Fulmarus glacialis]
MAEGVRAWTGPALACGVLGEKAVGLSRAGMWPKAWDWDGVRGSSEEKTMRNCCAFNSTLFKPGIRFESMQLVVKSQLRHESVTHCYILVTNCTSWGYKYSAGVSSNMMTEQWIEVGGSGDVAKFIICDDDTIHEGSPLGELHRCVRDGVKINVHIRTFKGLRGVCTGFLVAFDKFWNMALTDVDETYRKPVMGKAFYAEPQLTLTRLFDRLKLQESSVKKGADSKTVSEELALTSDSQTLGWKAGSGRGRAEDERERQKRLGRAGEKKIPGDSLHLAARGEADVGSGTAHMEGASAGGTRARSQSRRKRRPKVDYQQVFTRHINQIFIRGENVLLVHLAH